MLRADSSAGSAHASGAGQGNAHAQRARPRRRPALNAASPYPRTGGPSRAYRRGGPFLQGRDATAPLDEPFRTQGRRTLVRERAAGRRSPTRSARRSTSIPRATLERHAQGVRAGARAIAATRYIAYAVKANPNLAVLQGARRGRARRRRRLRAARCARALAAGDAGRATSSSRASARPRARWPPALETGSASSTSNPRRRELELSRDRRGDAGIRAACALRVNPDVDAGTHDEDLDRQGREQVRRAVSSRAREIYARPGGAARPRDARPGRPHRQPARPSLDPLEAAFAQDRRADRRRCARAGTPISHLDLGGGLGVPYKRRRRACRRPAEYGAMVARVTARLGRPADVRARPGDRRQRRRAADAGDPA